MADELPTGLFFDLVSAADVPAAQALELAGFPPDEAESLSAFEKRQSQAPDLFLGVFIPDRKLIGFICATRSSSTALALDSMSAHDALGTSACVHSVCVDRGFQRRGIALALLREFETRLLAANEAGSPPVNERILIITHEELRELYEKAGFQWLGKSDVVYGSRPWFAMQRILESSGEASGSALQPPQQMPPGIMEALQHSSNNGSSGRPFASFSSIDDLQISTSSGSGEDVKENKYDLLCPRGVCGSIILKKGVGKLIRKEPVVLEPPSLHQHELLPSLSGSSQFVQCWLVSPSPMEFENIGFSRPVESNGQQVNGGKRKKLLICAECDLGPLGWCEEGGSEFWLLVDRVAYRT